MTDRPDLRRAFERDGYVVVRGMLDGSALRPLRDRADACRMRGFTADIRRRQVQVQHDARGRPAFVKISQTTRTDPHFAALAREPRLAAVIDDLLGPGARLFRDVVIVKPALTAGSLGWHQDSAYWDVEPPRLVSAWIALTDVPVEASCLRVIPGSHAARVPHGLRIRGRNLPLPVSDLLRRATSWAGTGDNPGEAGGYEVAWRAKNLVLSTASRWIPELASLNDFQARPGTFDASAEVTLPARAGDVVFFHSLLIHGSGPNEASSDRMAAILSFMPRNARFVGRGTASFRDAAGSP